MKMMLFSEFYSGNFDDCGYELYLLRDDQGVVMYIGIARDSIWHRWFEGPASHMETQIGGRLYGRSVIGEVVARRFPNSWNWNIELWTREDCLRVCNVDYRDKDIEKMAIESIESQMIVKFKPLYNVLHSGGRHEDPLITNRLDELYKDIFG